MKYLKTFELDIETKYKTGDIVKFNDKSSFSNDKSIYYNEYYRIIDVYFLSLTPYYKLRELSNSKYNFSFIPEYTIDKVTKDELEKYYIQKRAKKYNI